MRQCAQAALFLYLSMENGIARVPAVVRICRDRSHLIALEQDRFRSFVESVALMVQARLVGSFRVLSSRLSALKTFSGGWLDDDSAVFLSLGQTLEDFHQDTIL